MSAYREKIIKAKATRKYRLTKTHQITPYIRKHLSSIRKQCAKLPEDKWCSVAAWTILQRDKVDIFRDDKVWDIPQKVREYIKEIITTDYEYYPGALDRIHNVSSLNFCAIKDVLNLHVQLIDKQIEELNNSKQQLRTAIDALGKL